MTVQLPPPQERKPIVNILLDSSHLTITEIKSTFKERGIFKLTVKSYTYNFECYTQDISKSSKQEIVISRKPAVLSRGHLWSPAYYSQSISFFLFFSPKPVRFLGEKKKTREEKVM